MKNIGIQLNDCVSYALDNPYPRQKIVFTIRKQEWRKESRIPNITTEEIEAEGRLQPVTVVDSRLTGAAATESHATFDVYISNLSPSTIKTLEQAAASEFTCDNKQYRIIEHTTWEFGNNWSHLKAVRI